MAASWFLHARLVGAVFALASISLVVDKQIVGLLGPLGVQPAETVVQLIKSESPVRFPTVFRVVEPSDFNLLALAGVASVAGVITALSGSRIALAAAWTIYLSICTVGGEFFAYPWDGLLLEVGALTLLVGASPDGVACFALRFLLFRLQLGMGMQKFYATGQNAWWDGSYLDTFYVWQPMPTPVAWYVHHLGHDFHWYSTRVVMVSQLVLPFGLFGPRLLRKACALVFLLEQAWIQFVGNYGVFNVLTAVLCLVPAMESLPPVALTPTALLASVNVMGGCYYLTRRVVVGLTTSYYPWLSSPEWLFDDEQAFGVMHKHAHEVGLVVVTVLRRLAPWRVCNDYGIFRVGMGSASKQVVRLFGRASATAMIMPLMLPTGFHQATSGMATVQHNRSLAGWFAPHQPRLDHSFFYAGLGANIGRAVSHEQHHLEPILHTFAFVRHVEMALLRCPHNNSARRLFAFVPEEMTEIATRHERCSLGKKRMWSCKHSSGDIKHAQFRPKPEREQECTKDAFGAEINAWTSMRRKALKEGLAREAKLQKPSGLTVSVIVGVAVCALSYVVASGFGK
jgi:hypothetical protein